jgi:hypothetical protein
MATNFPTSLDTLSNPAASDKLNSPAHATQHISANDALEALEAKVGADSSAVATSLDYKIRKGLGIQSNTPVAGSVTLDLASKNVHDVAMNAATVTIALSNVSTGQAFVINLVQDATGSRTATWFSGIKWPSGSAPSLSTSASAVDSFGFICTGAGAYRAYFLGFDLS